MADEQRHYRAEMTRTENGFSIDVEDLGTVEVDAQASAEDVDNAVFAFIETKTGVKQADNPAVVTLLQR